MSVEDDNEMIEIEIVNLHLFSSGFTNVNTQSRNKEPETDIQLFLFNFMYLRIQLASGFANYIWLEPSFNRLERIYTSLRGKEFHFMRYSICDIL